MFVKVNKLFCDQQNIYGKDKMHLPWLSIIFSILRSAIMDNVYPTIGSIKDLILLKSYLVDGLRVFQYITPTVMHADYA